MFDCLAADRNGGDIRVAYCEPQTKFIRWHPRLVEQVIVSLQLFGTFFRKPNRTLLDVGPARQKPSAKRRADDDSHVLLFGRWEYGRCRFAKKCVVVECRKNNVKSPRSNE